MMSNQEVNFLEDGPSQDFKGTTLQLGEDKPATNTSNVQYLEEDINISKFVQA